MNDNYFHGNTFKESRKKCPGARAQAKCSDKRKSFMPEGGGLQVVHFRRHQRKRPEPRCTSSQRGDMHCELNATDNGALTSNA